MNNIYNNFSKYALTAGASLNMMYSPDIISSQFPSICNSTIYNDNGRLLINLRNVNFIQCFEDSTNSGQCNYGNLCYITRDDDNALRTENYLGELNDDLSIKHINKFKINETSEPKFEMIGVEDIRLVRWNGILYGIGCNRDFDASGYCQMVMIEIDEENNCEKSRIYIKNPEDSHVEKNWVPIIDKPYHFMRWFNPMQIVKVNPETGDIEIILEKTFEITDINYNDHKLRGSSQIIPFDNGYLGIIHVVELDLNARGDKTGRYLHQFLYWDKEFNLVNYSKLFNFTGNVSEFCVGMCKKADNIFILFSTNDAVQYVLSVNTSIIRSFMHGNSVEVIKEAADNIHEYTFINDGDYVVSEQYAKRMFDIGYYAGAYINYRRTARINAAAQGKNNINQYLYNIMSGLSLANAGGRYLCELYDFQYAASLFPDRPEAHYLISNYFSWRGYPQLGIFNANAAYKSIYSILPQLTEFISNDIIKLNYIKSLWYTPNFELVEDLLLTMKQTCENTFIKLQVDEELNKIYNQKQTNNINKRYFGK